jgi:hypothetical protein
MKKIRQGLLPFDSFVKDGSVKMKNERKRLETKIKLARNKKKRKPTRGEIESKKRLLEDDQLRTGAKGWLDFMVEEGITGASNKRPDLMYLAYGKAPDTTEVMNEKMDNNDE